MSNRNDLVIGNPCDIEDEFYIKERNDITRAIVSGCSLLIMDDSVLSVDCNTIYIVNSDGTLVLINKGVYAIGIDNVLVNLDAVIDKAYDDSFPNSGVETGIRFKEFDSIQARDEWIEVYMKPSIANELFFFKKDGVQ